MTGQHHIIKDTSDTLVQLLKGEFKSHGYKRVHIIVEAPKPDAIEGKLPAVCLYLYQVSPDHEGLGIYTGSEIDTVRTPDGKVVEVERNAPIWVRCDYLISTWAQTPEDEQLLLGLAIKGLVDTPFLPPEKLKGDSFAADFALPLSLSSRLDEGTLARFWGSLNQPIRPAIQVWTLVPIMSEVERTFRRVEERVVGYERLGALGGGVKEMGPVGTPDVPPRGPFVKRTK